MSALKTRAECHVVMLVNYYYILCFTVTQLKYDDMVIPIFLVLHDAAVM